MAIITEMHDSWFGGKGCPFAVVVSCRAIFRVDFKGWNPIHADVLHARDQRLYFSDR